MQTKEIVNVVTASPLMGTKYSITTLRRKSTSVGTLIVPHSRTFPHG